MSERVYWMTMTYGCASCGHKQRVLLERGLEGPREQKIPCPRIRGASRRDFPKEVDATSEGRMILPVPMYAFGCPNCGKELAHIQWSDDRVLKPPIEGPINVRRFDYPEGRLRDQSCGVPVQPRRGGEG